mgnify:CR=1 FL=1
MQHQSAPPEPCQMRIIDYENQEYLPIGIQKKTNSSSDMEKNGLDNAFY